MRRSKLTASLVTLLSCALLPAACESGGVVGGECVSGLTECDGQCVDLSSDNRNCGACGVVCPAGRTCQGGEYCAGFGSDAGGAAGMGGPGGAAGAAGAGPGGAGTGGLAGSGAAGGSAAAGAGGIVVGPFNTAEHCGDFATSCSPPTPLCACTNGSCSCVPDCDPPLAQCGSSCVDLNADPMHCGACSRECPTRLCQNGTCVGATPGHIVAFCMSFRQAHPSHPQTVLLGNAVFLPRRNPVRVLAYEQYTNSVAAARVAATLDWAAAAQGRAYEITRTDSHSEVSSGLGVLDYEVLLVLDQPNAPPGELAAVGTAWEGTLDSFVRAGGTVILLDGGGGSGEMGSLMTSAQLFAVDGETGLIPGDLLHNRAPSDSVGVNVLSPFRPLDDSCTFDTQQASDQSTAFVVTDAAPGDGPGNPVVVHRVRGL